MMHVHSGVPHEKGAVLHWEGEGEGMVQTSRGKEEIAPSLEPQSLDGLILSVDYHQAEFITGVEK